MATPNPQARRGRLGPFRSRSTGHLPELADITKLAATLFVKKRATCLLFGAQPVRQRGPRHHQAYGVWCTSGLLSIRMLLKPPKCRGPPLSCTSIQIPNKSLSQAAFTGTPLGDTGPSAGSRARSDASGGVPVLLKGLYAPGTHAPRRTTWLQQRRPTRPQSENSPHVAAFF